MRFLSFNLCANVCNLDLILAEIDSIKRHQGWNPNLELRSEVVVLGGLAGKHGIDRVFNQVQMLQVRVLIKEKTIDYHHALGLLTELLMCSRV